MNEELSRLLAGELDSDAADALFARIAREPDLADAWERMMALPELLASLPLEAPPSALKARLYDLTAPTGVMATLSAGVPSPYVDAAPDLLDPAPYAPDPAEDTLDADRRVLRSVRLDDRVAPRPSRRAWVGAVGFLAMAAAAALSLRAPDPAPAQLDLPSGQSVVDGDVIVHAGDVRVHVDGRARVTVDSSDTSSNPELVVIDSTAVLADTSKIPASKLGGRLEVTATSSDQADRAVTGALPTWSGPVVRVEVERGVAIVGTEASPVRLAAGESRSFGARRTIAPETERTQERDIAAVDPANHRIGPVESSAPKRDPRQDQLATRTTVARVQPDDERPIDEAWTADTVAEHLESVAFGGAHLIALRCDALPCVAVYTWTGESRDWEGMLLADLALTLPEEFTLQQVSAELYLGAEGAAGSVNSGAPSDSSAVSSPAASLPSSSGPTAIEVVSSFSQLRTRGISPCPTWMPHRCPSRADRSSSRSSAAPSSRWTAIARSSATCCSWVTPSSRSATCRCPVARP